MDDLLEVLAGLLVGFIIGAIGFGIGVNEDWRTDTVERGLAIYCPQDGQWAWIGECGK
jgi:hypothetical protein